MIRDKIRECTEPSENLENEGLLGLVKLRKDKRACEQPECILSEKQHTLSNNCLKRDELQSDEPNINLKSGSKKCVKKIKMPVTSRTAKIKKVIGERHKEIQKNEEMSELISGFLNFYDGKDHGAKFKTLREYKKKLPEYLCIGLKNENGISKMSAKQKHHACEKRRTDHINHGIKAISELIPIGSKKSRGYIIMDALKFILKEKIRKKNKKKEIK